MPKLYSLLDKLIGLQVSQPNFEVLSQPPLDSNNCGPICGHGLWAHKLLAWKSMDVSRD